MFCACMYRRKRNLFLGIHLNIEKAPHPKEIIWENWHYSNCSIFLRKILIWLIIALIWGLSKDKYGDEMR